MKKLAILFMVLTLGCLHVCASDSAECVSVSNASESDGLIFVREITVYHSDLNGGFYSYTMHLVQERGNYYLSTPTRWGYQTGWPISSNPQYRRTNSWEGCYTHTAKVSGIPTYFNL